MIERGCSVQASQPKQAIGQQLVDVLRGMIHAGIGATPKFNWANP